MTFFDFKNTAKVAVFLFYRLFDSRIKLNLGFIIITVIVTKEFIMTIQQINHGYQLTNLLNMSHALSGGYNTEYSLYLIDQLLDVKNNTLADYYKGAVDILEAMSSINWNTANKKTNSRNEKIIFEEISEIAGKIAVKRPEFVKDLKRIIDTLKQNNHDKNTEFNLDEILEYHFYSKIADKPMVASSTHTR